MKQLLASIIGWLFKFASAFSIVICIAIVIISARSYRHTDCLWIPDYRFQTMQGRVYISGLGCGPAGSIFLWTREFDPVFSVLFTDDLSLYSQLPTRGMAGVRFYSQGGLWFVGIPLWMLLIVAGAPLVRLGYLAVRSRPRPGFCRFCNYDLTGNESGVCPECGRVIARV